MEVSGLTFSNSNPSNPSNKGDYISAKRLRSSSDAETKVMSLQVKPFTVAVYSVASQGGGRQLYAFDTARLKKVLQDFVESFGGTLVDDWYEVATNGALDAVTAQAKDMGGFAYDLSFR
jgi:hypothetical protein